MFISVLFKTVPIIIPIDITSLYPFQIARDAFVLFICHIQLCSGLMPLQYLKFVRF